MRERLADYLAVLGLAGSSGNARLVAGQFHDVVLDGEMAYRFPATRNPGAGCPLRWRCWLRLAGLAWLCRFRWAPDTSEARSAGSAAGGRSRR